MTAGFHHFVIEQGATFGKTLTLKDSSDALVNLTGYSAAEMDLRTNQDDSSIIKTLTAGSGITLGGTVVLNISATDTANMSVGDGVYDLRITAGDGTISRILEGTFAVRGAVSR